MIILARHGQTPSNRDHMMQSAESRVQGFSKDMPLSEAGEAETYALGHAVGEYVLARSIEAVLVDSSDAKRTITTRDNVLTSSGLGDKAIIRPVDVRLRELAKGNLEGMLRSDAYPTEDSRRRQHNDWDFRHGTLESGGETALEGGVRWLEWLDEAERSVPPKGVLVAFCHGLTTAYGLTLRFNRSKDRPPLTQAKDYLLPNCHALVLTKPSGELAITDRIEI